MSAPLEIRTNALNKPGLFSSMIRLAAGKVIELYIAGYFGPGYNSLARLDDRTTLTPLPHARDFLMMTNDEIQAYRFLDDATQSAIQSWKKQEAGFSDETMVDHFGVLFVPNGMIVSCLAYLSKQEEVKKFSDFAAAMAVKMKSTIA
jgi:hypothetical protein